MPWTNSYQLTAHQYNCGYCSRLVASDRGYHDSTGVRKAYICPNCDNPSYFSGANQTPGVMFGNSVGHLPKEIDKIYNEARKSFAAQSYTGSVLICRKLLMNIAVSHGAEAGKAFIYYVEYLAEKGYVPPNGKAWVDHIRLKGNEATHEIADVQPSDAENLITFSEMLLKFIYEFHAKIPKPAK